jgi:hypothetical protein
MLDESYCCLGRRLNRAILIEKALRAVVAAHIGPRRLVIGLIELLWYVDEPGAHLLASA